MDDFLQNQRNTINSNMIQNQLSGGSSGSPHMGGGSAGMTLLDPLWRDKGEKQVVETLDMTQGNYFTKAFSSAFDSFKILSTESLGILGGSQNVSSLGLIQSLNKPVGAIGQGKGGR